MCLELSKIIREKRLAEREREREREGERERDRKAPVLERDWTRVEGGGVGIRLVHPASQHLWPLSVFSSLSH